MIEIDSRYVDKENVYIVDFFDPWEIVKPWLYRTIGRQSTKSWELVGTEPDACAISINSNRTDLLALVKLKWA